MTPTARSKAYLEEQGYLVDITERWNPFAKIRQDLFGFIDILAVKRGEVLAVQCTASSDGSRSNGNARVRKIADHENLGPVRESGMTIKVHNWLKKGRKWELETIDIS